MTICNLLISRSVIAVAVKIVLTGAAEDQFGLLIDLIF